MRALILFTLAILVTGGLIACNSNETLLSHNPVPGKGVSTATPASSPADNARRINAEELHKLWEKNEVLVIDTRAEAAYKQEHIKGAISIPTGSLLPRVDELPRNKMIVSYCT
jgi:3-mercaptopyruvate sulfurtransferase SseA